MNLIKQLEQIDLNQKQAKVYLACLELGITSINEVAKKAGINRTTVYRLIEDLKHRGLVSCLKRDKKNLLVAEDIESIQKELAEQKQLLVDKENILSELMPQLRAVAQVLPIKPKVKYFEGKKNIKKVVWETTQQKNSKIYCWFSFDSAKFYSQSYNRQYLENRIKNRIYLYAITNKSPSSEAYKSKDQQHLRQVKYYRNPEIKFEVDVYIFADKKIALVNHREETAVVLEDKSMYQMLKIIFWSNWQGL